MTRRICFRPEITAQEGGDILTTVLESGYTSSWCRFVDWRRADDLTITAIRWIDAEGEDVTAESNEAAEQWVTAEDICRAWREWSEMAARGGGPVCDEILEQFRDNSEEPDYAGGLDAWASDALFQWATLGEVIYG